MNLRFAVLVPLLAAASAAAAQEAQPKVLVVTMFGAETEPWIENEALSREIPVAGLPKEFPW